MKLHVIEYLFKEGCRNTWQNRLMALASAGVLTCCLVMTGFAYMTFVNINEMFAWMLDQNEIAVFLDNDQITAPEDSPERETQRQEWERTLLSMDNVKSVEFLSKEDWWEQDADEDTKMVFEGRDIPYAHAFFVTVDNLDLQKETCSALLKTDGVEGVMSDVEVAQMVSQLHRLVLAIGGTVIVILLAVSLFIIINTIKLTVHNRRLEIYIMKSVGATDSFVRFPFVVEGFLVGLAAGTVGYGLLALMYHLIYSNFNVGAETTLIPFSDQWLPLLIGFLLGGTLVGILGSIISMSKYLRQEGGIRS